MYPAFSLIFRKSFRNDSAPKSISVSIESSTKEEKLPQLLEIIQQQTNSTIVAESFRKQD